MTPFEKNTETVLRSSISDVSVILPVRNECDNLIRLDTELREVLEKMTLRAEIIYVDDSSNDGSYEILLNVLHTSRDSRIRTKVVRLKRQYGQTAALAAGIEISESDLIITLDADGQNNPADIPLLYQGLDTETDVVCGWRYLRKDRFLTRRLPSIVANWLIGKVTGLHLHDMGCTFRIYRSSLLKELKLYGDMHRFLPVFLSQHGGRIKEIEISHRPRLSGVSKYGSERVFKVLVDLVVLGFVTRFYGRPMHFFGRLTGFFVIGFLLVSFPVIAHYVGLTMEFGFSLEVQLPLGGFFLLSLLMLLGALTTLCFGVLGEILVRIHHDVGGGRSYAIRDVTSESKVSSEAL